MERGPRTALASLRQAFLTQRPHPLFPLLYTAKTSHPEGWSGKSRSLLNHGASQEQGYGRKGQGRGVRHRRLASCFRAWCSSVAAAAAPQFFGARVRQGAASAHASLDPALSISSSVLPGSNRSQPRIPTGGVDLRDGILAARRGMFAPGWDGGVSACRGRPAGGSFGPADSAVGSLRTKSIRRR